MICFMLYTSLDQGVAMACSIVVDPNRTYFEHFREVRKYIERASSIIDGEVVRPAIWGKQTALVYAHHVLKGAPGPWFEVGGGGGGDCTIALDRKGERMRMVLSKGPEEYLLFFDQSDAQIEDRILRSDRRKVWPFHAGA